MRRIALRLMRPTGYGLMYRRLQLRNYSRLKDLPRNPEHICVRAAQ